MKEVTVLLPDSVELSAQEIQALILEKVATDKPFAPASTFELTMLLGRPVLAEELADLRHLIGLYYAERAADLFDAEWTKNRWTAATMQDWLHEHMRTAHGRPGA
ncbi:hypothetical protein GCM10027422_25960 [Hymenobacter arcticus]